MSSGTHLASDAIVELCIFFAIKFTPSQSPGDEAAKPASITSTFNFSNCCAIKSFSDGVNAIPGLCSPSLQVVSKMISWSSLICLF